MANLILAFTALCEFFKLFCLYYTLTHMKYNIFELSLDEYYFQAHALDLVQSVLLYCIAAFHVFSYFSAFATIKGNRSCQGYLCK